MSTPLDRQLDAFERVARVYEARGYRLACDRLRDWGAAHRGEIRVVPAEILAAALADWLRAREGLDAPAGETARDAV